VEGRGTEGQVLFVEVLQHLLLMAEMFLGLHVSVKKLHVTVLYIVFSCAGRKVKNLDILKISL
jgi:hypothetical protein